MGILGLAMSMFGVGYILTQIPAGLLGDRFGGRKVLAAGSVGWSFFTLLTPFAGTPLLMYLVRGLLGLAEGLNFPGATTVLSRWVPRKARARIQGLNLSGIAAGPLIATPLTVWIMTAFGWKAMFYFYGVLGFLWAGAWLLYSTERPSEHKGMSRRRPERDRGKSDRGGRRIRGGCPDPFESRVGARHRLFLFHLYLVVVPELAADLSCPGARLHDRSKWGSLRPCPGWRH